MCVLGPLYSVFSVSFVFCVFFAGWLPLRPALCYIRVMATKHDHPVTKSSLIPRQLASDALARWQQSDPGGRGSWSRLVLHLLREFVGITP